MLLLSFLSASEQSGNTEHLGESSLGPVTASTFNLERNTTCIIAKNSNEFFLINQSFYVGRSREK